LSTDNHNSTKTVHSLLSIELKGQLEMVSFKSSNRSEAELETRLSSPVCLRKHLVHKAAHLSSFLIKPESKADQMQ